MVTRHVLVGSGPASLAAAAEIRSLVPAADITIVTADRHGYYSRPGLAYHLARQVPERALFPFSRTDLRRLGARFVFDRVTAIRPVEHAVVLARGGVLPYDRLLLATGSLAIPLGVPGDDLDGVVKLDDLEDARDLVRRSRRARTAVVVGGGSTAIETVEGLAAHGMRVSYLMRKGRYWSDVLSEAESRIVEDALRKRGVEIHHFTAVAEVLGDGRVSGVLTASGETIPCGLLAVAIGVRPQKQLAESAEIACDRGVLVDEYLRSSDPDVFAAGDVAEVLDARSGKRSIEVLWDSAATKGRVAGRNMASGETERYEPGVPLNVTRLGGHKITIIGTVGVGHDSDLEGLARGDSERWRRESPAAATVEWEDERCRVRLALEADRLAGAIVIGDQSLSFALQDLLQAGGDVGPIARRLVAPRARLDEIIESYHRERQAEHAEA